ncbi:hypothetical protein CBL_07261 [Carabus blaptoides fortunei]
MADTVASAGFPLDNSSYVMTFASDPINLGAIMRMHPDGDAVPDAAECSGGCKNVRSVDTRYDPSDGIVKYGTSSAGIIVFSDYPLWPDARADIGINSMA